MIDLIKRSKDDVMGGFNQLITFLKVKDIVRSQAFYSGILGLPQVYSRAGKVTIMQVAADSFIGLVPGVSHGTERTSALSFIVSDLDGWVPRLSAHGVETKGRPIFKEEFGIYVLYATDPDGNTVELLEMRDPDWPHGKSAGASA
jgi:catechol 2,3-dioxygenase-like lactoylglutathione lyase family enzyme